MAWTGRLIQLRGEATTYLVMGSAVLESVRGGGDGACSTDVVGGTNASPAESWVPTAELGGGLLPDESEGVDCAELCAGT